MIVFPFALPRPVLDALRSGSWLTPSRLRVYPAMLGGALTLALLGLLATSNGFKDHWNRPLGTDFSGFYIAGQAVLAGLPALPYDNAANAAAQAAMFGPSDSALTWPYPPYFLAIAALLAAMPYLVALAVWQGTTLAFYVSAMLQAAGGRVPRMTMIGAALAFPAVTINLLHGHNGFLTAGLLSFGAMLAPRRPMLAGLLLGLLAYKPQFALAVPVALLAGGFWRAGLATGVTIAMTTIATLFTFGLGPWQAFFASLDFTRHVVLEQGGVGFGKLQSAFAAARLLGGSIDCAYAAQLLTTAGVLVALAWLWRSAIDHRLKAAALMVAALLTTPYGMDYDMVALGPALALLLAHGIDRGFRPYGRTLLACVWLMPLLARAVATTCFVPLGFLVMCGLFWHIVNVARRDNPIVARDGKATAFRTSQAHTL